VETLIRASSQAIDPLLHGAKPQVALNDVYIAATRVVMRLVVVLFAEARELLPITRAYSLQGLQKELGLLAGDSTEHLRHNRSAWPRILGLFGLMARGSHPTGLKLPAHGGGLFEPGSPSSTDAVSRALAAFESPRNDVTDDTVRALLEALTRSPVKAHRSSPVVMQPVDFSDLSPEYIGILYEGLLDFELRREPEGEWVLARWGGTRKGAGTFYTPPQLADPTVRRTLQPLAYTVVKQAKDERTGLMEPVEWAPRKPEEILALKVCDPAMGSGSFLVSALRFLTQALLESLIHHGRLSPRNSDPVLESQLKRQVVESCIHGVDLDRVAVDLARLALWIETRDGNVPFEFLDHKLKVGNALVGCWLDRFQDYPLAAWEREGGDKAHTRRVRQFAEEKIYPELVEQLRSQVPSEFSAENVRRQLDAWCAVWFWPGDQLTQAPRPTNLHALPESAARTVDALTREHRFFHWEIEFPDVFIHEGSGFDAIIGNPPWDIQKPNSKEFFSNHDPLYRAYGKQEALDEQEKLFARSSALQRDWVSCQAAFKARSNWVRHAGNPFGDPELAEDGQGLSLARGRDNTLLHSEWRQLRKTRKGYADPRHPYLHQGAADLNTYKMFLETAHALLREGGQLGFIVPSGLYHDKGSAALRTLFLTQCRWHWLFGFENREAHFDIHRSFKFAPIIIQKGGQTEVTRAAFMRRHLEDWEDAGRHVLAYPRELVARLSRDALAFFELREPRDMEVLVQLFKSGSVLGEKWEAGYRFTRELDKTNDSRLLKRRSFLEAQGLLRPEDDVRNPEVRASLRAKGWAPVWEGKCCRFEWWVEPSDLFARQEDVSQFLGGEFPWGVRRIARNTDERTLIGCIVPEATPTMYTIEVCRGLELQSSQALYATVTSFILDFVIRFQVASSVALSNLAALPLPAGHQEHLGRVAHRLLSQHDNLREWASAVASANAVVAHAFGLDWDELSWILADCDLPLARLARSEGREHLSQLGFWRVDKERPPELRTTVLTLIAFAELKEQGIDRFLDQRKKAGWLAPRHLKLSDYGLGHDERARAAQPVGTVLEALRPTKPQALPRSGAAQAKLT
jgi:hypothetical protein